MKKIKVVDVRAGGLQQLCETHVLEAIGLLQACQRTHGWASAVLNTIGLPFADRLACRWLSKNNNPYREEIASYAQCLNKRGVYALNLAYEWGCTTGIFDDDEDLKLLHTLDWPFIGLGDFLVVAHQAEAAGEFFNITWPALAGTFNALAPGRFVATINQAPMRRHHLTYMGDWLYNRYHVYRSTALPPEHLLRKVFESAKDYQEAKTILRTTPVCLPVIYTLVGTEPGQGCIIERLEEVARVRELGQQRQIGTANDFETDLKRVGAAWTTRGIESARRQFQMDNLSLNDVVQSGLAALPYPILSDLTRLVFIASAKTGRLQLQGWERKKAVTEVLHL